MAWGKGQADQAAAAGTDERVTAVSDAARVAQQARLVIFTAELDMPAELWGLAIGQVERHGYLLTEWSVDQRVAFPVFRAR